jgi:RNA recognition motif-containing protein
LKGILMSNKLYVGGLPYSTTSETLESIFQRVGEVVSAQVITDRETGRSKGFGFVEMNSAQEATAAVSKFNGQEIDGRTITVNEARAREPRRASW